MNKINTTRIGTDYENRVFNLFSSLLYNDELAFASQKHSKIFQHKKYPCISSGRTIDFDITIETYNPNSRRREWSSLVVIECKCLTHTMDISDLDEFETKMRKISDSGIKGVMVTTKGFTSTSINQARKSHIALIVLSEEEHKWIVSRDTNRPERQMQILLGKTHAGLTPTVYQNEQFVSLFECLNRYGISLSEQNVLSIPWLTPDVIREKANELYSKCSITSDDIAGEVLAQQYPSFRINFAPFPSGVLGSLSLESQIITISNELLTNVHRRNFTLAHELGHLFLHQYFLKAYKGNLLDYEERLAAQLPDEIVERMEKQANLFASYLLMPQRLFLNAVKQLFKAYSITTGRLYLDNQPCNKSDVYKVLGALSLQFNVSKEAVKMRLINEGLLIIDKNTPQRIDVVFRHYY